MAPPLPTVEVAGGQQRAGQEVDQGPPTLSSGALLREEPGPGPLQGPLAQQPCSGTAPRLHPQKARLLGPG